MKALAALLFACLIAGCAPATRVVLLADDTGNVGQVEVKTRQGAQVLTQAETASDVASIGAAPEAPRAISQQEITAIWGQALAVRPKPPRTFSLYFHTGTTELTDESRATLPDILAVARDWQYPWIAVSGHADAVGGVDINNQISLRRAEAVQKELIKAGVPSDSISVYSYGKGNPLIPTPDGVPEPRNRRVTVTIR